MAKPSATFCLDPSMGAYVEFYCDDDNNSGYGDNPKVARWWGSTADCRTLIASGEVPKGLVWVTPKWEPSPHAGEWF